QSSPARTGAPSGATRRPRVHRAKAMRVVVIMVSLAFPVARCGARDDAPRRPRSSYPIRAGPASRKVKGRCESPPGHRLRRFPARMRGRKGDMPRAAPRAELRCGFRRAGGSRQRIGSLGSPPMGIVAARRLLGGCALVLCACAPDETPPARAADGDSGGTTVEAQLEASEDPPLVLRITQPDTADWPAIERRGLLRVLVPRDRTNF